MSTSTTGTVLVTGASSGIGRATATRLAGAGWAVHAAVRDPEAHRDWASTGVNLVRLDVRDPAGVLACVESVLATSGGSLDALINNAGIPAVGPVEFISDETWAEVLDVNVVGQMRVTRAALPALRAARGRIVFMSSLSGRVAMPFLAPYAASKHALEACSDSLRRETRAHGIRVSLIEPGNIATAIWDKGLAARAGLPEAAEEIYRSGLDFGTKQGERAARTAIPAEKVAAVVERALTVRNPRSRYIVGKDARLVIPLGTHAPQLLDRILALAMARTASKNAPTTEPNGEMTWNSN
jgi:NAD(P)-dependent dehydrogenase (short-subunit alcohol dehydrogenase family)